MTAPIADETAENRNRLLQELRSAEILYAYARRSQEWPTAKDCAEKVAQLSRQLELNERGEP